MCGRFTQVVKAGELAAMYRASAPDVERPDRWNGAPTQAFLEWGQQVKSLLLRSLVGRCRILQDGHPSSFVPVRV